MCSRTFERFSIDVISFDSFTTGTSSDASFDSDRASDNLTSLGELRMKERVGCSSVEAINSRIADELDILQIVVEGGASYASVVAFRKLLLIWSVEKG